MSINKNLITDLQKSKHTIKAESTQTINFMGADPNYYRITNGGNSDLFMGVSMTPTKKFFDMKIPSGSTKLFVDAYGHENIYIFNPSTEDANIILTSFKAEFDPSVLAMSDFGADFTSMEINSNSIITGFESELPNGNNVIGKVGLTDEEKNYLSMIETIKNENGAISGNVLQMSSMLSMIDGKLSEINSKESDGNNSDLKESIDILNKKFIKVTEESSLTAVPVGDYKAIVLSKGWKVKTIRTEEGTVSVALTYNNNPAKTWDVTTSNNTDLVETINNIPINDYLDKSYIEIGCGNATNEHAVIYMEIYKEDNYNDLIFTELNHRKAITVMIYESNITSYPEYELSFIHTLSNDGETDMILRITLNGESNANQYLLKAGEVLSNVDFGSNATLVIPKNSSYSLISNGRAL